MPTRRKGSRQGSDGENPQYLAVLRKSVSDYLRDTFEVCDVTTTLAGARQILARENVDLLVVRRRDRLVAALTKENLPPRKLEDEELRTLEIFAKDRIATVSADDSILTALEVILQNDLTAIPVRREAAQVTGILRRSDLAEVETAVWANFDSRLLVETGTDQNETSEVPTGPFTITAQCQGCAILIFVPEDAVGRVIDSATGGYGYSHVAIDCCEVDQVTGKRVMIEATSAGVHRSSQDRYGNRRFARIPLSSRGIDCKAFCDCVKSKIGQPYDTDEAISKGANDDPGKQICSGLAAICLPADVRQDIARKRKAGELRRDSVVVRNNPDGGSSQETDGQREIFVSPNALAEYFGAPRGENVGQDEVVQPPTVPAPVPMPVRPPIRRCRVKITLLRVQYNGDDIGNDWRYNVTVMGQTKRYSERTLDHNRSDPIGDILYDQQLGFCEQTVSIDIYVEAIEVDPFVDDVGSNSKTVNAPCPSQRIEELTVGVKEGDKTARMKFVFNVELFCE